MTTAIQMIQMLMSVPPNAEVVVLEPQESGDYEYAEASVWIVSDTPVGDVSLFEGDRTILISTFNGFEYATTVMGIEEEDED